MKRLKSLFGVFLCLFALTFANSQFTSAAIPCPVGIAHKGNSYWGAPVENSMGAFNAAFSVGSEWVETDVHFTSDSVPVLMHDATVDATTNGTGAINRMTAAQFTSLLLDNGNGQHPPTLDQLLDVIKANPAHHLLLEIKARTMTTAQEQILLQKLQGYESQIHLMAFADRFQFVQHLKAANPAFTISILGYDPISPSPAGIVSQDLEYTYITAARVANLHAQGLKVKAWTANNATVWNNLRTMGVDAIITNKVDDYLKWAKVTCPADPTPAPIAPTVSMQDPAQGSTLSGMQTISANAADDEAVSSVQFQLNGVNVGDADTTAPYSYDWDTTAVADGTHTLRAIATDNDGLRTTSSEVSVNVHNDTETPPDPVAPTVTITAPAADSTVAGTETITANAADDSAIASVQFQLDGANVGAADTTAPYSVSWNTATVPNGTHTLRAVATDDSGLQTTSADVTVTVNNVVVTPPANKEYVTNSSFETNLDQWTGLWSTNSKSTRVTGGYNGSYAIRSVNTAAAATQHGFTSKPDVIDGSTDITTAGKQYNGSVWVKPDVTGQKINLYIRERNTAGTTVGSKTITLTTKNTSWQQIAGSYTAAGTGNRISITVWAASSAQNKGFLADMISFVAQN